MSPRWSYEGPFRIHFNKKEEFPRLASITAPDHSWEMLVEYIQITGDARGFMNSACNMEARSGLEPAWWLQGYGKIEVIGSAARIVMTGNLGETHELNRPSATG